MFSSLLSGSAVVQVKVALSTSADVAETRVFDVRCGTSSCLHSSFSSFLTEVEGRFGGGLKLKPSLSYTDNDGDTITVTTDQEFETALKSASSSSSSSSIKFNAVRMVDDGDACTRSSRSLSSSSGETKSSAVASGPAYQWLPTTATSSIVDVHAGFRIKFTTCT